MNIQPHIALGEIFDIARGGSPRPIDQFITEDPAGINWIMIGDATEGSKYIETTKKRIRAEGAQRSRRVRPGDFLLTNSMSFGKPYIMRTDGCIHDGWLVLSPRSDQIDADFFYYLLGSKPIYAEFERRASGATVKNLNIDLVRSVTVSLPPLSEQRRIAAILDKADAIRAKRREALAQLDRLTQSIFIEMFGDPGLNPQGFPIRRLSELVATGDTISYGVIQPGGDVDDGIPLIRVGDLIGGRILHETIKRIEPSIEIAYKRSRLVGDEILVSCVGSLGVVALVTEQEKGFNIARAVARIRLSGDTNRVFMAAQLGAASVQRYFTQEQRTVSQPTLNIKQLAETKVVCPPLAAQMQFEERIAALNAVASKEESAYRQLDALFASIQHRAFRGEL